MLGEFRILKHDPMQLYKGWPIFFIKFKHQVQHRANILLESLPQSIDASHDKLFSIIFLTLLIEARDVFHDGELVEEQTNRENVTFVNIVLSKS